MTILDLFSGIGGFSLALKNVYKKEIQHLNSDIDKYANQVYKYNFKNSINYGSVTDIQSKQLPKIDIITFGSPCQDFSLAGKRLGLEGERSSLISKAIRLIRKCKPRFFIWENVKGTFSSNNGEDFWAILKEFTNIGGYRLEWQLLNTKWFLPQNRERIYLVGYIGEGCEGQIFPISETNCNFTKKIRNKTRKSTSKQNTHTRTISSRIHKMGSDDTYIKVNDKVINPLKGATNYGWHLEQNIYDKKSMTRSLKSTEGSGNKPKVIIKDLIRRLTPIECERLQGFPDNWTKYGTKGLISDTQRYKMCGNAITVNVAEEIFKRILCLKKE